MKAMWNGKVIAESDDTIVVENNHYFPAEALEKACFENSDTTSSCFWKGKAHYYSVSVDGKTNKDAAWYYPDPKPKANKIKNYVAFWRGVEVTE
ncbi:DUF427 domain-containing protein [Marinibactrum halimedae]|uniref:DUF427 domain-containing protein n=1 Tax=Marinibactrum halimedae TaxID=1444977 RepID=A0AA37T6F4_9GAMM|nr:DUF427 domain-containing protein [Marinibactrum halimedae]MCD9460609.1 DUF427 domain-containing protein [Marinibactrum halimedae]GLS27825.1 hypothetical protein GCM10007877_35440 [Marinibactrum halimedae]